MKYRVGFIGFGLRGADIWREALLPTGACIMAAIADPRREELSATLGETFPHCRFYATAEEMLEREALDGVVIAVGCNLHTHYARLVAKYKLPLFLEKPVSINEEQLAELETVLPAMNEKTVVSFPLRLTPIFLKVKEILDSGRIGEIAQIQAINNVSYGRCYYHGWYRDDSRTGGLFVTKATHDLDYLNLLTGQGSPTVVCAMESKMVFKGDKPAGLLCRDCPDAASCPESPENLGKDYLHIYGGWCCFATDTGNHDSATVTMQYPNGLHVVYTQNFIARRPAGKRGARFIGYKGTLEFDFRTSTITLMDHFTHETETVQIPEVAAHMGGDGALGKIFVDVMGGIPSPVTLRDGIVSAKICLAAKRSAETKAFVEL